MRRIVTVGIGLGLCALLSACGSSSSKPKPPSRPSTPKAEFAAMAHAAGSQHSVHFVSASSAPGHTLRIVADVGAKQGIQRITLTDHGQTGTATEIVSGSTGFLRGDAFMMRVYFGFSKSQATKYAGKWISVPSSLQSYESVSDDTTFPSYLSHLFPSLTQLTFVKSENLIGVRGTVKGQTDTASVTIFAPKRGKPLPVKQIAKSSGQLGSGVVTMSNWNEPVRVSQPTAVSITTVIGGG